MGVAHYRGQANSVLAMDIDCRIVFSMSLISLKATAVFACASLSLAACSSAEPPVAQVDAQAILPAAGLKKTDFIRHYMLMTVHAGDELPFTTSGEPPKLDAPRRVWVAVFVRTPSVWTSAPAGVHVVRERDQFPEYFHGGCQVVNLISDATTGKTLSSWCNIDTGDPSDGPTPIPHFNAENSPFR
ncbi:hypothetical protein [Caulobacter sp. FWC2]|uniref:hypothetical protein n=1 Tax=Caulobacter sp. FWC2 TaxID=69664 RepID=UPI0013042D0C|nr:hypothetical protein [Caulobacter sp. FWC2]